MCPKPNTSVRLKFEKIMAASVPSYSHEHVIVIYNAPWQFPTNQWRSQQEVWTQLWLLTLTAASHKQWESWQEVASPRPAAKWGKSKGMCERCGEGQGECMRVHFRSRSMFMCVCVASTVRAQRDWGRVHGLGRLTLAACNFPCQLSHWLSPCKLLTG